MNESGDNRPGSAKSLDIAQPETERPHGCLSINEIGKVCGETESLEIIEKFHKLYEERLRMVDNAPGIKDRTGLKVQILSSWVNDLAEQNATLVKTVEQLEVEATSRVALLEERLQQSSHIALKYLTKLQDCDKQLRCTSREKNQNEPLKMSEEFLRNRIANLQNDMFGLIELIRRAYQNGSWNVDGLDFCEITHEDIFGHSPPTSLVKLKQKCPLQVELHHAEVITEDKKAISKLAIQLEETEVQHQARILEVSALSSKLKEKNEKIRILTEKLADTEKSCSNIKEALKTEVAKKNEETFSLRQDLERLEDSVQQANVHTSLKDDIIKEMRKDIKLIRMKDGYQEVVDVKSSLSEISTNLQVSWEQICSSFKGIPHDYIMRHTDLMEREQSVVKLLLEKLEALRNDAEQQSKMKKGVNFASVSIEEHEKKIQELQRKLKDTQNKAELSKIQAVEMNGDSLMHAGKHLSKELAEYRVKIVIAQAALEEIKDEVDILLENLRKRENKLADVEDLLHQLQDTLCLSQNDELFSQASFLKTSVGAGGKNVTQEANLEDLLCTLEAAGLHPKIGLLCAEGSDHEEKLAVKNVKTYEEAMEKIGVFIENLEIQEEKILDKQKAMDSLKENLNKIQLVMKDLLEKVIEYSIEKEVFNLSCVNSEIKIQKLQQELETVQDDLEHCIESLQPAAESGSDVE